MENSGFQFNGFLIKKTKIEIDNTENLNLSIKFKPSGTLNKNKTTFKLVLDAIITEKTSKLNIQVQSEGVFTYRNLTEEKLNQFLYLNAPAILFPYIRSYITSLTALSGISPVILPTLNLSSLKDDLKNNVTIIE
ncbi:protein-export chaperone SecB [Tenacibaculum finnmarkense]|uniref:protein-export chaperone SecB n=1 Tax=Tenacibaculum finnmarkense TaxID=2781243 RepID=UPI003BB68BF8